MKPIKLDKFPVTAPDGTEYRVTIREYESTLFESNHVEVTLYVERLDRRFRRFTKVFGENYVNKDGVERDRLNAFPDRFPYSKSSPDFVKLAQFAIADYRRCLAETSEYRIKQAEKYATELRNRTSALEAFRQWDGKITEQSEVSE